MFYYCRLLYKNNLTTNETEMWLTKIEKLPVSVKLKFFAPLHLSAMTIWNYNASMESSYYGVSKIKNNVIMQYFLNYIL